MRVIVKAIEDRGEFVEYLKERIPEAEFCFDQIRSAFDTFLRSLEMAGNDACLHLEEDIILTRDFMLKVNTVVNETPNNMIQFFSMRKADLDVGSRWDNNFLMNQCVYYPPEYSRLIREYYDVWVNEPSSEKKGMTNIEAHPNGTDVLVRDFLKKRKEKYWIHIPSLVEHRVAKSVIDPRRSSKRQSKTFEDAWI